MTKPAIIHELAALSDQDVAARIRKMSTSDLFWLLGIQAWIEASQSPRSSEAVRNRNRFILEKAMWNRVHYFRAQIAQGTVTSTENRN